MTSRSRTLAAVSVCTLALVCLGGLYVTATRQSTPEPAQPGGLATATFAGGCFWCMEPPFDELPGVVSTTSGYTGGHRTNPTYEEVSAGDTGHAEVVEIRYDPGVISYERLLAVFWRSVDPLDAGGQFCDRGEQYRTTIFFHDAEQQRLAAQSKARLDASERFENPIATTIVRATEFYPAEDYHQDYYEKNPLRYKLYRFGCGRDRRLAQVWGDTTSRDLTTTLFGE